MMQISDWKNTAAAPTISSLGNRWKSNLEFHLSQARSAIWAGVGIIVVVLSGCASLSPQDFATSAKQFKPDEYFSGHVRSWGVRENRSGDPQSRFTTESFGRKDESGKTVITQTFTYEDGHTQQRIWKVRRIDENHFEGLANDGVGVARGVAFGNAFYWTYKLNLKPGNPFARVHLKQWIYQAEGSDQVFTRAIVTKFGVTLGEITETFEKLPEESQ